MRPRWSHDEAMAWSGAPCAWRDAFRHLGYFWNLFFCLLAVGVEWSECGCGQSSALWDKTRSFWHIQSFTFPRAREWAKWTSKRTSEHSGGRERSEQSRAREQVSVKVNKWVVEANERTDERVAQYLRLYSCSFHTTVQWACFQVRHNGTKCPKKAKKTTQSRQRERKTDTILRFFSNTRKYLSLRSFSFFLFDRKQASSLTYFSFLLRKRIWFGIHRCSHF